MKKRKIAWIMIMAMVVALMPISSSQTVEASTLKIKNVTKNKKTLYVGSVYQIATNAKKATYSSSNKKVAAVSKTGLISATKKGNATVKVTNAKTKKSAKLRVKVKNVKAYKISNVSGTYNDKVNVKIKAKKGYVVYYTFGSKFKKKNKIKSNKSKTFTISKTQNLKVYFEKSSKKTKISTINKKRKKSDSCVTYRYVIRKTSSSEDSVTSTSQNAHTTNVDETSAEVKTDITTSPMDMTTSVKIDETTVQNPTIIEPTTQKQTTESTTNVISTTTQVSKPSAPIGLTYAGNDNLPYYFAWQAVEGVDSYNVYLNDIMVDSVNGTSANLSASYFEISGTYSISVTSVKDGVESDKTTITYEVTSGTTTQKQTTVQTTTITTTTEQATVQPTTVQPTTQSTEEPTTQGTEEPTTTVTVDSVVWNGTDPVYVYFDDDSVEIENEEGKALTGTDIEVTDNEIVLNSSATYTLSGTLTDGNIVIKKNAASSVIVLNGVDIKSSTTSPLYANKKATDLSIVLADGSTNYLTGPEAYTFEEGEDEPDAALFAKKALTLKGTGTLYVTDPNGDAIKCKDKLTIESGNYIVNAGDDGITGKDAILINGGTIDVTSAGDGIKTNLQTDETLGYINIAGGNVTVKAQGDAIQADTNFIMTSGTVDVSTAYNSAHDSFKGIKAGGTITAEDGTTSLAGLINIKGGTVICNTVEDAIHGKKDIIIEGGNITAVSYSDGIQAEYNLTIKGKDTVVDVTTKKNSSYTFIDSWKGIKAGVASDTDVTAEGELNIEEGTITVDTTAAGTRTEQNSEGDDAVHSNNNLTISGGTVTVAAGDDAYHADNKLTISGGKVTATTSYEGIEGYEIYLNDGTTNITSRDDGVNAAGGNDSSGNTNDNPWGGNFGGMGQSSSTGTLYINGGVHTVQVEGDGLDSNGDIYMTGGEVYVYGPTSGGNGILDYGDNNNKFEKSGGLLIGAGTSSMAVYPTCTSGAVAVYNVSGSANKVCSINDGTKTYTFTPTKSYSMVIISTPDMTSGTSYTLTYNGSSTSSATANTTGSSNSTGGSRPGGRG